MDTEHWTNTDIKGDWLLKHNATKLATGGGWDFWENPLHGDEAPILATRRPFTTGRTVVNTQDFDLPPSVTRVRTYAE